MRYTAKLGLASLLCTIVASSGIAQQATLSPGLAVAAPPDVRSVETPDGFMVEYAQSIPATSIVFRMVPVPAGQFLMGSPDEEAGRSSNEGPRFRVSVQPFWIGKCEVRWVEYKQFMSLYAITKRQQSHQLRQPDLFNVDAFTIPTPLYDPSFTYALGEEPNQPAVTMTQYAAKQYTKWLSGVTGHFFRLPTEAEWEYACRAGTSGPFSCPPEELPDHAWYYDNSDDEYHAVGTKQPNAWGLHDMHGNVAEFVLDGLTASYAAREGSVISAMTAIAWPTEKFGRVIRGGCWESDAEDLRCAARQATADWRTEDPNIPKSPWWFTDEQAQGVGFRVVRPLVAPPPAERARFWDPQLESLRRDIKNRVDEGRGAVGVTQPRDE